MRAAVVYESYFGHTRGIAVAIAEGLRARADVDSVDIYEVGDAPADLDVDLLVVGGPTHAWQAAEKRLCVFQHLPGFDPASSETRPRGHLSGC